MGIANWRAHLLIDHCYQIGVARVEFTNEMPEQEPKRIYFRKITIAGNSLFRTRLWEPGS